MNFRKFLVITAIFLFIISLSLLSNQCFAEEKKDNIIKFVKGIYINYSGQNFGYVYNKLHPGIKNILTEIEYREFQKKNFKKYSLEITDIEVDNNLIQISMPEEFRAYVAENEDGNTWEISISYQMSFINNGSKIERDVNKKVYIYIDKEQNYFLLWNPRIVK